MWSHFDTVHNIEGSFSCTCGNSYNQLPSFLRHYVECPVAATDLQDPYRENTPFKKARGIYKTDESFGVSGLRPSEIYQTYRQTNMHSVTGPSIDKPYGCPKCFKGFKSKSLLDQHMHLHYPPRYKCRWCGNVYRWPPVYYHHKQRCKKRPALTTVGTFDVSKSTSIRSGEHSIQKFEDLQHPKERITFAQQALAQFMNMQSMPFSQDLNSDLCISKVNGDSSNVPLTYLCTENFPVATSYLEHLGVCSTSSNFESLSNQTHINSSTHNIDRISQVPTINDQNHMSQTDGLLDMKDMSLVPHPNVGGIFPCSICNKHFNSKLSLRQHVDGKHRAEGKYLCPTCGRRYRWGASFYYHKKTCALTNQAMLLNARPPELITSHN